MADGPDVKSKAAKQVSEARSRLVDRLYREHGAELINWIRRRFGEGPPEPEDIAQSIFAKFWSLPSIDHIENFRAFLFTMASNQALSGFRKNARGRAYLEAEYSDVGVETEKITPEHVYEAKEQLRRLCDVFETLTDRQKEIVVRSRLYGQTYFEIKAEKGWSIGTISGDLRVAIKTLSSVKENEEGSK